MSSRLPVVRAKPRAAPGRPTLHQVAGLQGDLAQREREAGHDVGPLQLIQHRAATARHSQRLVETALRGGQGRQVVVEAGQQIAAAGLQGDGQPRFIWPSAATALPRRNSR